MLLKIQIPLLILFFTSIVSAEEVGPWNLDTLKSAVPAVTWLNTDQPIRSLTYAGEKVNGSDTEVFAFYASPATIGQVKEGSKFPGIVLIHGGGGTAFAEWVNLWAKRGYAAIAMDLSGSRPADPVFDEKTKAFKSHNTKERTRLTKGGLNHSHKEKFDSIGGDTSDDWPFHAAASVMRAHSLLRSLPEVDAERTAVTGISWGGYTTCLAASLDDRFKAAVPVYGCGFLHEGESVQKPSIDKLEDRKAEWVKQYDPGSLLPRCEVPIFFVNGTNDIHYVLDSYMKSYNVVPGEKHIRIKPMMPHGHQSGWAPKEIGLFVDSKCIDGANPLPVVGKPVLSVDSVEVAVSYPGGKLKSAKLNYTIDGGIRSKRKWESLDAEITAEGVTAPKPPTEANTWFITVTDDRDAMVSSEVIFSE
ncbi:MAG: PhoPQ-activated protein PqaA family protein [Verrucomicrobiales bacterium]|nr:PhoPQ-activated protein PqaA family protein [Verrucomicrobiales bacterium]